ncbi:MAG: hypothetical protein AAF125_13245, partial [Chloroflexota bacterium]
NLDGIGNDTIDGGSGSDSIMPDIPATGGTGSNVTASGDDQVTTGTGSDTIDGGGNSNDTYTDLDASDTNASGPDCSNTACD